MDRQWRSICDAYMRCTSYSRSEMHLWDERPPYDRTQRAETYLTFPDAPRVALGEPRFPEAPDLWKVLRQRRSLRNYTPEPLTLNQLNVLLWAGQGLTADLGDYQVRTAPSSGATFPSETFLFVHAVEGLKPGVYHLDVRGWALEQIAARSDMRAASCSAALDQEAARVSAVNFVWTAVIERCREKYYERAYRYLWWDSAHISENVLLAATAMGLGSCVMGAWYDDEVNALCGIDGEEHTAVLFATVGRVAGQGWKEDRRPPPKAE